MTRSMQRNRHWITAVLGTLSLLVLAVTIPLHRPVPVADPVPVDELVHHLQLDLAGCQVKLESATTPEQEQRAQECLQDTQRALDRLTATPTPSSTSTPTPEPSSSPTPVPTTAPPSSTPSPTPTSPTWPCALPAYPTASCTGVPATWHPVTTVNGDLTVSQDGRVLDNFLVKGTLFIRAQNVTVKNSMVYGQIYNQVSNRAYNGLLIMDTTVGPPSGILRGGTGAVGVCGYTAIRVHIRNSTEGFRIGGGGDSGNRCQKVTIQDSFVKLVQDGDVNTHADGIQEYDGIPGGMEVIHNTIDARIGQPEANAAIAVGAAGFGGVFKDNLVGGGGYVLRFLTSGSAFYPDISGNRVIDKSWGFNPGVDVDNCSLVARWHDNRVATIDSSYRIVSLGARFTNCPETP